jgi:hypothetical protein
MDLLFRFVETIGLDDVGREFSSSCSFFEDELIWSGWMQHLVLHPAYE